MRRFNLSEWAVHQPALVLFLILGFGIAGALAFARLGRAEDPNFTIKVAIVTAIWPGATAEEMQDQVSDRIEKKLQELPYFDRVQTYTKPSFTAMQVVFRDHTPAKEVPQLFYQLRKKLGDLRPELPRDLIGPSVNDEYGDVDSILYMLTGEGADYAQLKTVAEGLRQRLLKVPSAVKVNLYGVQDEKIFVEFSHAKLATLGIPPQALFDSLQRQNAVVPAGTVETGAQRIPLRITGALDGARAVAETPVEAVGRTFRLGDIATVIRGFEDPSDYLVRQRGKPALGVGVVMAKGANILDFGKAVGAAKDEFMAAVPQGIDIEQIADQPRIVDHAIFEFLRSFAEALAIVLVVSFLSLGWRTGIVVALSVPLVLAITFVVMAILGIDLHRITLGALIIALGLLVDDAIIAVEMMVVKIEQGWDRMRAAAFAWTSTAFPMLTGTLGDGGWLPADRLRQLLGRRICRRDLLGCRDRARGLVVRGGDLHPVSRREAAAEGFGAAGARQPPRHVRDPHLQCAPTRGGVLRAPPRAHRSRDRGDLRRVSPRVRPRAAAVLSPLRAPRTVLPDSPAGRHGDRRDRRDRAPGREAAWGRSRRRDPHHLYRPGLAALLARA